jgi:aspartyl-tRNA(Asn)/glutamyl-tRNA(Gln) amidotransferase subunit B
MSKYIPIIGLEMHVELNTNSKMFCGCSSTHFQLKPNTNVCPICLGLPGALPYANKKAIDWTIMLGLALNCKIAKLSKFDRKHYFYPDLPKGYQISQYDMPFCEDGYVDVDEEKVRITRVHLEEDTGKLKHKKVKGKKVTLVDFNRSGVPLVEIVTEPDLHSAEKTILFAQKLRRIIRYLGISDCDMEKGSMRLEANVSVARVEERESRRATVKKLPDYKVELKNINSFRYLEKAIEIEIKRQSVILMSGEKPDQETRGYDEAKNETFTQRSKEEAQDYRYFPEPDIPTFKFDDKYINNIKKLIPELPSQKSKRFIDKYNIPTQYIDILISEKEKAEKIEEIIQVAKKESVSVKEVISTIVNKGYSVENIDAKEFVSKVVKSKLRKKMGEGEIDKYIQVALDHLPKAVADYKAGKENALQALIGKVMGLSKGEADPQAVRKLLVKILKN